MPFFYVENLSPTEPIITLNEDVSRHVTIVLRMQVGEQLRLTDGKGNWIRAEISGNYKKICTVTRLETGNKEPPTRRITIGISLLKNASRFEWFLEKVTELGINEIIPVICERTEKQQFRYDRMKNIMISAMLQSQQVWLPVLYEPAEFEKVLQRSEDFQKGGQKFIAHFAEQNKQVLNGKKHHSDNQIILIGPEGDFTIEEIDSAIRNGFIPVALGETRLRTETAGIVAATILSIH